MSDLPNHEPPAPKSLRPCGLLPDRTLAFVPSMPKLVSAAGTFHATPEARGVTRAPHLQGDAIPTIVRFSNGGGNPDAHDGAPEPRRDGGEVSVARR